MFENLFVDWFFFISKLRKKQVFVRVRSLSWCPSMVSFKNYSFQVAPYMRIFKLIYSWFVLLQKFWFRVSRLLEIRLLWFPVILVMPSYMFIFWCDLLFKASNLILNRFYYIWWLLSNFDIMDKQEHGFFYSFHLYFGWQSWYSLCIFYFIFLAFPVWGLFLSFLMIVLFWELFQFASYINYCQNSWILLKIFLFVWFFLMLITYYHLFLS